MTTWIGDRWKRSDAWSRVVLITRKLPFFFFPARPPGRARNRKTAKSRGIVALNEYQRPQALRRRRESSAPLHYLDCQDIAPHEGVREPDLPVVMAGGNHLLPFRTEQLSPPAPMVLPLAGGRVGHRRYHTTAAPAPHEAGCGASLFMGATWRTAITYAMSGEPANGPPGKCAVSRFLPFGSAQEPSV